MCTKPLGMSTQSNSFFRTSHTGHSPHSASAASISSTPKFSTAHPPTGCHYLTYVRILTTRYLTYHRLLTIYRVYESVQKVWERAQVAFAPDRFTGPFGGDDDRGPRIGRSTGGERGDRGTQRKFAPRRFGSTSGGDAGGLPHRAGGRDGTDPTGYCWFIRSRVTINSPEPA